MSVNSLRKNLIKVRNYGKFILSGEHSVLRGGTSLIFPLKNFHFDIFYKEGDFQVSLGETFLEKDYLDSYKKSLQKALASVGRNKGQFHLECTLPRAAGLGSSASFCLGVSQIFFQKNWISKNEIPHLSLQMENDFHGKSSGGDIRVIEQQHPILFKKFNDFKIFKPCWRPFLYLHDTGIRTETKKCIERVSQKNNSKIDEKMKNSVHQCVEALNQEDIHLLQKSLHQAYECFDQWGLCPPEVQQRGHQLKKLGALAVKPTGSGGGGFMISLWNKPQPQFMSVF